MKIAYSQTRHPKAEGMAFRNPRFFAGCEDGVTEVHVFGDWPQIAEAYRAKGVEVIEHDPRYTSPSVKVAEAPAGFVDPVQADEPDVEASQEDADVPEEAPAPVRRRRGRKA